MERGTPTSSGRAPPIDGMMGTAPLSDQMFPRGVKKGGGGVEGPLRHK